MGEALITRRGAGGRVAGGDAERYGTEFDVSGIGFRPREIWIAARLGKGGLGDAVLDIVWRESEGFVSYAADDTVVDVDTVTVSNDGFQVKINRESIYYAEFAGTYRWLALEKETEV